MQKRGCGGDRNPVRIVRKLLATPRSRSGLNGAITARFRRRNVGARRHSERQEGEDQEREVAAGHNETSRGRVVTGGLQLSRKVRLRVHR